MPETCELCGHPEANKIADVAGARVVVCDRCAQLGEVVDVIKEPPKPKELKQMEERKKEIRETVEDVVDGIGEQVRAAREKMGLKQDELAKKINEHESMVRRVEHGYIPSVAIARKLGKVLHLKLVEASDANEQGYTTGKGAGELTLGDIIVIKKGKK